MIIVIIKKEIFIEYKEIICKFCFAENHRKYKCHLPEIILKNLKITFMIQQITSKK